MKKSILIIALILSLFVTGCQTSAPAESPAQPADQPAAPSVPEASETYTIKVAHAVAETHASHIALIDVFKKEVEENSEGRITVEVYPNAQLGSDRQALEAVSLGSNEMTMSTMAVFAGFDERATVLDLPFLFKSKDAAYEALDGELGDKLNEITLEYNIKNLGFAEGGFRHITNSKRRITEPADLAGIKIRTMENPIHVSSFKAFGANPTPMAFGELFTALSQKTVDGQENPINLIYASKFQEVQEYLTLSGHVYGTACLFINNDFYNSLPEDLQLIVSEAATNTKEFQRNLITQQDEEFIVELEKVMDVYELTAEEKQKFIDAAQVVYDEYMQKHGSELVDLAQSYNQ